MSYSDRTLTCVDCGVEFIHSAADQEFYAEKGFVSDPKRCPSCRASRRRHARDDRLRRPRDRGPARLRAWRLPPPASTSRSSARECGNAAQVPFKPRMDKPVYCSDCFRTVQARTGSGAASA